MSFATLTVSSSNIEAKIFKFWIKIKIFKFASFTYYQTEHHKVSKGQILAEERNPSDRNHLSSFGDEIKVSF